MPFEDDSSPQQHQSPSPKRSRFDKDHNAQLIYEREEPQKPAIPSLLSLDLSAPFTPVNLGDSGFRNFNDREDRFGDNSGSGTNKSPWANSNGPFQANTRTGGSTANPWEIPSLLDGAVFRDRDNGSGFNNRDRDRDQGRNERGSRGKFNNFGNNSNPDNRRSREGRQGSRGNRFSGSGGGSSGNRRN